MSSELVEKFSKFAEMERKHAEQLRALANGLRHPALRAIFASISRDSEKHAELYSSLVSLLKDPQPFISEEDLKRISEVIEVHINTEARMIAEARSALSSVEDPRMKLIIAAILDDELQHHKLLLNVKEKIAAAETLTENLLWDMIWKDSPWHGSPGG